MVSPRFIRENMLGTKSHPNPRYSVEFVCWRLFFGKDYDSQPIPSLSPSNPCGSGGRTVKF